MKIFSETQVDDLIKLKFGSLVSERGHRSYVSNQILGKLFKVSKTQIRKIYLDRFEAIRVQK